MSGEKQKTKDFEADNGQHFELLQKLVNVNKTSKVVKGGRVFSFNALVVVGNGSGRVRIWILSAHFAKTCGRQMTKP